MKLLGELAPLSVQANVRLSEFASPPLAVRLILLETPTEAPMAAGVCEAQVGGEFFTTVHVCVTELEPLPTVATRVLLPEFKAEDAIFCEFEAPVIALPFRVQVVEQLVSLGVTLNSVLVPLAAATR